VGKKTNKYLAIGPPETDLAYDTDLTGAPYYSDFHSVMEDKGYVKHVFRPGVSVQVRELNGLQDQAQAQVERMGDAIFKAGTIINGCGFRFLNPYPYAKILDAEQNGDIAVPSSYVGLFAKNSSNLQAMIIDYQDGFESTTPDLKSIYLHYNNAGTNQNTHAFAPEDVLTIFDSNVSIFAINVESGGLSFANTDQVVITPALIINVSTGTFTNGSYVTQSSTGANLQIVAVDDTTLALSGQVILRLQPRDADLANALVNATAWSVANNESIRNSTNTAIGMVEYVIGSGAEASIVTDGSGLVTNVAVDAGGQGYGTVPNVRIRSSNNSSGLAGLTLTAQNYKTRLVIASAPSSVGNGYAFGVGEGLIYQKGFMLKVDPQTVIVSKYTQTPNAVSVAFLTREYVIDENQDTTLRDNTIDGDDGPPGAVRLKMVPSLVLINTATSTPEQLKLVTWTEGNPYSQQQSTVYSKLGDEMDRRTYESGGDFVIDKFLVTTRSPFNPVDEGEKFGIVIDPGTAYIQGHRIQTMHNHVIEVDKGHDTTTANNRQVQLDYGNYVLVNQVGGVFQFNTGDEVQLRSAAKTFLGNTELVQTSNTDATGTSIGTANIRGVEFDSGIPGTPTAVYRLYLFNIRMTQGKNFRDTRSIYYNGTYKGFADVVLTNNNAVLVLSEASSLVFRTGAESIQTMANIGYHYRTIDQTCTFANTGILVKSIAATPDEFYPWTGTLTSQEAENVSVIPVGGHLIASANLPGTVTLSTTSANVTGSGTNFLTTLAVGDWVQVYQNSTVSDIKQVMTVANDTHVVLDANGGYSQAGVAIYRMFPRYVPIPFSTRSGLSLIVDANNNVLTANIGFAVQGSTTVNTAVIVDIERTDATPATKTAVRDRYVKIYPSNNESGMVGPWCLGVPDTFRLKGVWVGNSTVNTAIGREVTGSFYADSNQEEDFLNLSYLYLKPNSGFALSNTEYILAKFDYFTGTTGSVFNASSYLGSNAEQILINDSTPLINLGSAVNSFEVPELYTGSGRYFDLLGCVDFRPVAANTVAPTVDEASAPLNPSSTLSFGNTADPANDKKFPVPMSEIVSDMTYYVGRIDTVALAQDGNMSVYRGSPAITSVKIPTIPSGSIRLNNIIVRPYPNAAQRPSLAQMEIYDTRIANEKYAHSRLRVKSLSILLPPHTVETQQPTRFTHKDVGSLARRVEKLEYIAALSALETDITSRVIPSSVDETLNRFKFGFQVDDFSTTVSQERENPQYAASIARDKLRPPVIEWVLPHGSPTRVITPPFVHTGLISQNNATETTAVTTNTTIVSANTWLLRFDQLHSQTGNPGDLDAHDEDVISLTMANVAGPAALYFHVPPVVPLLEASNTTQTIISNPGVDPVSFKVYQGNTLIRSTGANNAVVLTAADRTRLKSNVVPAQWFLNTTFSNLGIGARANAEVYVLGSGKFTWNHNPALGNEYTVVSQKWNIYDHWRWALEYPSYFAGQAAFHAPVAGATSYTGHSDVQPPTMLLSLSDSNIDTPGATSIGSQAWESFGGMDGSSWQLLVSTTTTTQESQFPFSHGANSYTADSTLDTSDLMQQAERMGGAQVRNTSLQSQCFRFTAYGLKPSCVHQFLVQNINKSAKCRPVGKALGAALATDENGYIAFDYFYDGTAKDGDITTTLLSNTAPIRTTYYLEMAGNFLPSVDAGVVSMRLEAPNSVASYNLPVVADLSIPLNLIKNKNYSPVF
jgi:hypothetical protein